MTFESVKLDHYCYINPEVITKKYPFQLIRYYDISSVNTGFLNEPPKKYYLSESPSRAKRIVRSGDIIISTVRPNRRSFLYLKAVEEGDIASTGFAILRAKQNVDSRFIYYLISEQKFTDYLVSHATGSAYPAVSPENIMNAPVPLLNYAKQKTIADILSSLDDKIELNRQMCKTLEDIASALFKSWFIDFEPVKAKAAGRKPEGLSPEIAELFPDSFVDSSLGKIPKGWEISELGKIAKNIKRNIKSSPETEILPYVPIDCITSAFLALHNHMPGILAKTSLIKFEKWQILFGAMRPYFHKVCIAPFAGTTRTTAFVLDPINSVDFGFLLITVFQKTTIDFAVNTSQGSTIPYAVWEGGMAKMPIILPPKHMRQVYNLATINIFEKILNITEQNETLSLIRDLLLPKLMNGEIKIQEAEILISATI